MNFQLFAEIMARHHMVVELHSMIPACKHFGLLWLLEKFSLHRRFFFKRIRVDKD